MKILIHISGDSVLRTVTRGLLVETTTIGYIKRSWLRKNVIRRASV